jgi:hypothetical protein
MGQLDLGDSPSLGSLRLQDDKFTLAGFRHGRNANKKTKASSRSTQPRAG